MQGQLLLRFSGCMQALQRMPTCSAWHAQGDMRRTQSAHTGFICRQSVHLLLLQRFTTWPDTMGTLDRERKGRTITAACLVSCCALR